MFHQRAVSLSIFVWVLLVSSFGFSEDVLIQFHDGEIRVAELFLEEGQIFIHPQEVNHNIASPKKTHAGYRDFSIAVTEDDKSEIRYILKTLAQKSLTALWGARKKLESSGKKIDHIHPLKFLECIFTDEELKVYIYNIKKRGTWVWGEFIKGIKQSLEEEQKLGNLRQEFFSSFAVKVKIDLSLVASLITSEEWEDFMKSLIDNIPREGNPGRYDQ